MREEQLKFIEEMNRKFGKNTLRPASDIKEERAARIPSGSLSLDIALGGGIPLGRFIQISGAFSSTKSSLTYHIASNFQKYTKPLYERIQTKKKKQNDASSRDVFEYSPTTIEVPLTVALIQSEAEAWTNEYGTQIGIDVENLIFNPTAGMEEALEIGHRMQEEGIADLIIYDSLEAMVPMKEYDKDMNDGMQMGIKPKLFGEYFRKFQATNNLLSREGALPVTVIGINQLREKIGAYGDPEYTPGGRAIGFAASVDLRLKRRDWITIGSGVNKQIIGQQTAFKVHKNKTGTPQRTGSYDFYFDEGGPVPLGHIDVVKEIFIEGVAYGIIKRSGAWYEYEDMRIQGGDPFLNQLRKEIDNSPDLFDELRDVILDTALNSEEDVEDRFGEDDEEDWEDE
ncbi:recombinase A [compost metagenome]